MPAKIYDNDDLLLKMFAANDPQALNIIYKKHYAYLLNITNGIVQDMETSKDIIQDLFFVLWERRHSLKITKPIKAYLIKSAINRALNFKRNSDRHKTIPLQGQETWEQVKSDLPSDVPVDLEELKELVKLAILKLPPQSKVAFILSRKHNMSYREIASHMKISMKAVEKHLSKALRYLRSALKPYLRIFILFMV